MFSGGSLCPTCSGDGSGVVRLGIGRQSAETSSVQSSRSSGAYAQMLCRWGSWGAECRDMQQKWWTLARCAIEHQTQAALLKGVY